MGHLKKRGNKKYQIVIELDPDPETGKRNFIYKTVNCTKSRAKEIMQDMEKEIRDGIYVDNNITLEEHLEDWLKSHKKKLKPKTFESYNRIIHNHIILELGKYKLNQFFKQPKLLEDYYDDRLKNGRLDGEGGLSNRSVRYQHSILRKAFDAAVKWKRLKVNPADMVEPPKKINKEAEYLNSKQLNKFLNCVDNTFYRRLFEFTARTGLRRGEALGLQWDLVDFDKNLIIIKQSLLRIDKELVIQETTKNSLIRNVPLSKKTKAILEKIKEEQDKAKSFLESEYNKNELVFINDSGGPKDPSTVTHAFKRYARKAGLNKVKFHSLRHSFASILKENGEDLQNIQKLLGHTTKAVTEDIYTHVSEKAKKETVKKLDTIL